MLLPICCCWLIQFWSSLNWDGIIIIIIAIAKKWGKGVGVGVIDCIQWIQVCLKPVSGFLTTTTYKLRLFHCIALHKMREACKESTKRIFAFFLYINLCHKWLLLLLLLWI